MKVKRKLEMSATLSKIWIMQEGRGNQITTEIEETEESITVSFYSLEIEIPFDEITTRTN